MNVNKVLLIGNITRDPEMRSLPSGQPVVNFGLATNRIWRDKEGQKQQQADFHNIVAFGKLAETVNQYMKKGSMIFVEGRLTTRSWDAQDGSKRSRTEIIAENVQFGPRSGSAGGNFSQGQAASAPRPQSPSPEQVATVEYPEDDVNPEEIPF
ncbi:MAG: single-strand DNA-binding protein [Parcubacteria group bacterium Gr01-1014_66]|nr:MAG: single-strand DNA-binding protein [Parcubacteria group bacterium Gr01-1014_66]